LSFVFVRRLDEKGKIANLLFADRLLNSTFGKVLGFVRVNRTLKTGSELSRLLNGMQKRDMAPIT